MCRYFRKLVKVAFPKGNYGQSPRDIVHSETEWNDKLNHTGNGATEIKVFVTCCPNSWKMVVAQSNTTFADEIP